MTQKYASLFGTDMIRVNSVSPGIAEKILIVVVFFTGMVVDIRISP